MSLCGSRGRLVATAIGLACTFQPAVAAPFEISFGETAEIENQGNYGYCVYYALSNFLELWPKDQSPLSSPALDVGFITMSNNYDTRSGSGQYLRWAWISLARHGVIPRTARLADQDQRWPAADWETQQTSLQPKDKLRAGLDAIYIDETAAGPFDSKTYLRDTIGLDPTSFRYAYNTQDEQYKSDDVDDDDVDSADKSASPYRFETFEKTEKVQFDRGRALGIDTLSYGLGGDGLYNVVKAQLYKKRPVLIGLNVSLSLNWFSSYEVLGNNDLVKRNEGYYGGHAVVAIAHCDKWETEDPICKRFAAEMKRKNVPECIVYENSWGDSANETGYVCISKIASRRVLRKAMVMKSALEPYMH